MYLQIIITICDVLFIFFILFDPPNSLTIRISNPTKKSTDQQEHGTIPLPGDGTPGSLDEDADTDEDALEHVLGHPRCRPRSADNPCK